MQPCYIKYEFVKDPQELDIAAIQKEFDELVLQDLPLETMFVEHAKFKELCPKFRYELPANELISLVKIKSLPPCPCCGTHVKSLKYLAGVKVTKQKLKGNELTIHYDIA